MDHTTEMMAIRTVYLTKGRNLAAVLLSVSQSRQLWVLGSTAGPSWSHGKHWHTQCTGNDRKGGGAVESDTMNRGGLWFGRDDGLAAKDHRMRWDDERGGQHEKKKKKREDAGRRQNRDFP